MLAGVVIFLKPGTAIQIAFAFLISFAFLLFHVSTQPYINDHEGTLQMTSLISICLTLFGGLLLKTGSEDEAGAFGKFAMQVRSALTHH